MRVVSAVDLQLMNQRFWEILLREGEVIRPALKLKGWPAVQMRDELNNNHMITEKYPQLLTFKQIWAVMKLVGKYFWKLCSQILPWGPALQPADIWITDTLSQNFLFCIYSPTMNEDKSSLQESWWLWDLTSVKAFVLFLHTRVAKIYSNINGQY